MPNLARLALCAALLVLPLLLWRQLQPQMPEAWLALGPLAAVLALASGAQRLAFNRARMGAALLPDTWLRRLLSGRIDAALTGLGFALVATPLLAWAALRAGAIEAAALIATGLAAAGVTLVTRHSFARLVRPAWQRAGAVQLALWLTIPLALPLLTWLNWAVIPQPQAYRTLGLLDALQHGYDSLPQHGGQVDWLWQGLQLIESAKLWLVHNSGMPWLAGLVFALDAAVLCFITARCAALTADLVHLTTTRAKRTDDDAR